MGFGKWLRKAVKNVGRAVGDTVKTVANNSVGTVFKGVTGRDLIGTQRFKGKGFRKLNGKLGKFRNVVGKVGLIAGGALGGAALLGGGAVGGLAKVGSFFKGGFAKLVGKKTGGKFLGGLFRKKAGGSFVGNLLRKGKGQLSKKFLAGKSSALTKVVASELPHTDRRYQENNPFLMNENKNEMEENKIQEIWMKAKNFLTSKAGVMAIAGVGVVTGGVIYLVKRSKSKRKRR